MARASILIMVAVEQPETRKRICELLADAHLPPAPVPFTSIRVEEVSLPHVEERIRRRQRSSRTSGFVLISDGLVDEGDIQMPLTGAARHLLDEFTDSLLTTIAVMEQPQRVIGIERCISRQAGAAEFGRSLDRCLYKLAYLSKPVSARPTDPSRYRYRVLRFEHELLEYFRLRRDTYSVMCYLDRDTEQAPSGLEIDWFDKSSVHVGVYYRETGFERLIGTGRLIATERIPSTVPDRVSKVARQDPVLRLALENAVGLQLPVLQSHGLVSLVNRLLDQKVVMGEVSRIIVTPEHRGLGLSRRITEFLIRLATQAGLSDLLLECLPIHTSIYRKSGFELIPTAPGRVYKIGKTMDVMARSLGERSVLSPGDISQPAENRI